MSVKETFSEAWVHRFAREKSLSEHRKRAAIEDMQKVLPELVDHLKYHGAHEIWLYGSFAEGRARPDSDIDLAVDIDFSDYAGLFRVEAELEDMAGRSVHLISFANMSPLLRETIFKRGERLAFP